MQHLQRIQELPIEEQIRRNTRYRFYKKQGVPHHLALEIVNTKEKHNRHRMFLLWRDGKCLKCGSRESLTIDHIIPVSVTKQLRKSNLGNKQILCRQCNLRKGTEIRDYRNGI